MSIPVRCASDSDLACVLGWLEAEFREDGSGFFCNRDVIEDHHSRKELHVALEDDGTPVAFAAGASYCLSIVCVKKGLRRKGFGRALVEHMVGRAQGEDACVMAVQCEPQSSIPFWRKMGFVIEPSHDDRFAYAYLVIGRKHRLPPLGDEVKVVVRFYPEDRLSDTNVRPTVDESPRAVRCADGVIHLDQRVVLYRDHRSVSHDRDPVVGLWVNDTQVYLGKAKYPQALSHGVEHPHSTVFFLDRVFPDGKPR